MITTSAAYFPANSIFNSIFNSIYNPKPKSRSKKTANSLKVVQAYECTTISLRHLAHESRIAIDTLPETRGTGEDGWKADSVNTHQAVAIGVFDINAVNSSQYVSYRAAGLKIIAQNVNTDLLIGRIERVNRPRYPFNRAGITKRIPIS